MRFLILFAFLWPQLALAQAGGKVMQASDVVILGEVHDNPPHHEAQARFVRAISPSALVVEMLTPEQAEELKADPEGYRDRWNESGWPDYDLYLPVFTAADVPLFGAAVPREVARQVYTDGGAAHFSGDASAYGLTAPLPDDQLAARLDLQFAAHCEAMPRAALGGMIEMQRLRDATLAKAAIDAFEVHGGPVVVITGNGHARKDWGVPSYLARLRPDLAVFSLGQGEDGGTPEGGFDLVLDAPAAQRPDPCLQFGKSAQ
ncbi:ChaN family lipoprotein [Aliiroseovarius crassostreae]|uniref:ChaN family lipoprotein n=1 Tax=Aliiroseovarius crassostreae TaxID=154981 RepID=UPI00220D1500|nr:ChaN family lipoprotein [Aliiroseovarius crassostreae]UWP99008.1 ChaN family lipoprotein [Aliiroseovarius crassostreae]